jgi:hypothetical protein
VNRTIAVYWFVNEHMHTEQGPTSSISNHKRHRINIGNLSEILKEYRAGGVSFRQHYSSNRKQLGN